MLQLTAYPRADGRWGFRNHVLVLPLHAAACPAAQALARDRVGVVAVSHDWEGHAGQEDTARAARTLVGFAAHPNVAATLMVGLSDEHRELTQAAQASGGNVEFVSLAEHRGTRGTLAAATPIVGRLLREARRAVREPAPLSAICLGLECGGSDAWSGITANPALGVASDLLVEHGGTSLLGETSELLGAEHLLAARANDPAVAARVVEVVERLEREVGLFGVDLRGSQPAPGNIEGGLTTIEEKSLGAAKKGGSAPIVGVLEFAQRPTSAGLFVMDTPGQDIEQMVGMVAAGAQIVAFTTGRGTPTGSPIAPCLKISTNSPTAERLADIVDLDAGTIVEGREDLNEVGERIFAEIIAVANGKPTRAERRGHREFAISRVEPRAP